MPEGNILIISDHSDPVFIVPDEAIAPPLLLHVLEHLHRHWDTLMAEGYARASFKEQMGGKTPDAPSTNATTIEVIWDRREVREVNVTSSLPAAKLKVLLETLPVKVQEVTAELERIFGQMGEHLDGILESMKGMSSSLAPINDELRSGFDARELEFELPPGMLPGTGLLGAYKTGEANRRRQRRYHLLRVR